MQIWFTRSNGNTVHNNPANSRYVLGEPPTFPETAFDHRDLCLQRGFARVGWPATGDLRQPGWLERGRDLYAQDGFKNSHVRRLKQFASIKTGDLVLMPADMGQYHVHLGSVALAPKSDSEVVTIRRDAAAYYYHWDVAHGEWFENAHRVNVRWSQDAHGAFGAYLVAELGGLWRQGFGEVLKAGQRVRDVAASLGLASA